MADFEIIAEGTLSSGATTISLTGIPQTYSHLEFQLSARGSYASAYPSAANYQFNGDTGTNYGGAHGHVNSGTPGAEGYELGANSSVYYGNVVALDSWTANIQGVTNWFVPNYTSTSFAKQVFTTQTLTDANSIYTIRFGSGGWNDTSAITSITILDNSGVGTYEIMAQSSYWLAGWA